MKFPPLCSCLAIIAAAASASVGPARAVQPFPDVPTNHWAAGAVEVLAAKGILIGYPDGTFNGPTPAQKRKTWLIIPGKSLGSTYLGEADPWKVMGHGTWGDSAMGRSWEGYESDSPVKKGSQRHEVDIYTVRDHEGVHENVEQIWTNSPTFHTEHGIRVGSSIGEITRRFHSDKPLVSVPRNHPRTYLYDYVQAGIAFEIRDIPVSPGGQRSNGVCQAILIHPRGKPAAAEYYPHESYQPMPQSP